MKSKGGGKKSIRCSSIDTNIELLLRTVISANQLIIHGAVADMCHELFVDPEAMEKPKASGNLDNMEIPSRLDNTSMLLRHHEEKRSNPDVGNAHVLDLFRNPNSWQLFSKAQFLDQFWKFKHCKKIWMDIG